MKKIQKISSDKRAEYKKYMQKCYDLSCDEEITQLAVKYKLDDKDKIKTTEGRIWIDYIVKNGQGVKPVIDLFTKLIFLTNLKTDDEDEQKKIDTWLNKKNIYNNSNYSTLQLLVTNMLAYGNSGARVIDKNLTYVAHDKWTILTADDKKQLIFDKLVAYMYSNKVIDSKVQQKFGDVTNSTITNDKTIVVDDNTGIISLDNFLHLKYQAEGLYGISPLSFDQLQIKLSLSLNRETISDINNDNIGRLFLTLKERLIEDDESVNNILDNALAQSSDDEEIKNYIKESVNKEVKTFTTSLLSSNKNSITVVPEIFDMPKNIESDTQAKDFITILSRGIEIPARIYGIHPSLLGGANASNSSVTLKPLIDWTVRNAIVPMQKNIISQAGDTLKRLIGIKGDIYFDKFDDTSLLEASQIAKNEAQANLYNSQAEASNIE